MNRSRSVSHTRKIKNLIDYNQPSRATEFEEGQPMPSRSVFTASGSTAKATYDSEMIPDQPEMDLGWNGFGFERVRDYNIQSHML